jgi:hypothetical protein
MPPGFATPGVEPAYVNRSPGLHEAGRLNAYMSANRLDLLDSLRTKKGKRPRYSSNGIALQMSERGAGAPSPTSPPVQIFVSEPDFVVQGAAVYFPVY